MHSSPPSWKRWWTNHHSIEEKRPPPSHYPRLGSEKGAVGRVRNLLPFQKADEILVAQMAWQTYEEKKWREKRAATLPPPETKRTSWPFSSCLREWPDRFFDAEKKRGPRCQMRSDGDASGGRGTPLLDPLLPSYVSRGKREEDKEGVLLGFPFPVPLGRVEVVWSVEACQRGRRGRGPLPQQQGGKVIRLPSPTASPAHGDGTFSVFFDVSLGSCFVSHVERLRKGGEGQLVLPFAAYVFASEER